MHRSPRARQLTWHEVAEGDELPAVVDRIDVERVVASAASTWTFFGGHIDADYARSVQGRSHVYLATGPILGLLDRYVTSWAGPRAFLARRSMRMVESLCAGDELRFEGRVTKKWMDDSRGYDRSLVEIDLRILNAAGKPCVLATAVFELPLDANAS
jgi:acyl dehydratase